MGTKGDDFDLVHGRLVRRLLRSVRLHQRAARRPDDPGREQHQLRVLQQRGVQRADGGGVEAAGQARAKAYGKLDLDIMKKHAPWVPVFNYTIACSSSARARRTSSTSPYFGHAVLNALAIEVARASTHATGGGAGRAPSSTPSLASVTSRDTLQPRWPIPRQAASLGDLPVPRRHDHHLPDLLRHPGRPGAHSWRAGLHAAARRSGSRSSLHLNDPLCEQYGASSGSSSVTSRSASRSSTAQDVNDIIAQAAPVTASLVFGGAIFWLLALDPDRDHLGAPAAVADRPRARWCSCSSGSRRTRSGSG